MPASGSAGRPRLSHGDRRRTREQRKNLRSGAFDLLAVVAALVLVGLGLANLYLTGAVELAVTVPGALLCFGLRMLALWRDWKAPLPRGPASV